MNVCATALSRVKIRNLTRELREMVGVQKDLYFPIVPFIEWVLGDPDNDFSYEIIPVTEMKDTYGTTNTESNIMRIREDVYVGAIERNPRDRFTLCHELGHFLLHQPQFISFARGGVPVYRQPEWQANTFAAELMAPYDLVKDMSPDEISVKCGMSMMAANIQYKECHKFDV
ncbi:MAG: ImmA/IrrE family metallo-endopeptidase [Firmicutes bacterium]|nr:ImmA/IrrE family metallo-endopeptidase [Bacillota bacterium]